MSPVRPGAAVRPPGARRPRPRARAIAAAAAGSLLLVLLRALAGPRPVPGPDVHRPDADCARCHTADRAALAADPAQARVALVADLDQRCLACHGNEGPSHATGMKPRGAVPAELPLSADGRITCATCHFVHGEGDRARDWTRIDNRRGRLCLTCHTMSELR